MRKHKLFALLVAVLFVAIVFFAHYALAATHQAKLTFGASTTAGATYNVYKSNCLGTITNNVCSQESAPTLIASGLTTTTYTDTNITGGSSYAWFVRAYCDAVTLNCGPSVAGESGDTNHWAAAVPKDQPTPPTNLTGIVQ